MTPAQEKALWDFVRALAQERHLGETLGTGRVVRNQRHETSELARALLAISVLAEEAPPAKEPRCRCSDPECSVHTWPPLLGTAPAPKQERHPFSDIELSLQEVLREINPGDHKTILERALRLYREERAASDLTEKAYQQVCRANVNAHGMIEELRAENASLRGRIARATAWRRKFGPPDDTDIRILEGREGKGEGTEDRDG